MKSSQPVVIPVIRGGEMLTILPPYLPGTAPLYLLSSFSQLLFILILFNVCDTSLQATVSPSITYPHISIHLPRGSGFSDTLFSSVVLTSEHVDFTLVPLGVCEKYEEAGNLIRLVVNEDALTADLTACTEVGFAADFFTYFITASPVVPIDQHHSNHNKNHVSSFTVEFEEETWKWRHYESVPSPKLLNSQYDDPFHQSLRFANQHEVIAESDESAGNEEVDSVRMFSDHWKMKNWSSVGSASHQIGDTKINDGTKMSWTENKTDNIVKKRRHNICLLFGGEMDGMKSKVHMLIESFTKDLFQWSYWSDVAEKNPATQAIIYDLLTKHENVRIFESVFGFTVQSDEMSVSPSVPQGLLCMDNMDGVIGVYDSFNVFAGRENSFHSHSTTNIMDVVYEYMYLRLSMASFQLDPAVLSPPWVADAWSSAVRMFSPTNHHPPCDALLFGNDKSALPLLLEGVARLLRIPRCVLDFVVFVSQYCVHLCFFYGCCSVMEMPNLHPHPLVRPNFLVADSWFVLSHYSVYPLVSSLHGYGSKQLRRGVVMSPGVDVEALQQIVASRPPVACPPRCGSYLPLHSRAVKYFTPRDRRITRCGKCFTIGIICRLSPEKSVGLFLLAASELVHTLGCDSCRFIIIGDGKLINHLRLLSDRLNLKDHVQFMGWLSKEDMMVRAVSSWDVAVTTGAWRETFSIVGLELLTLGIPLVTYASGGMGEYIVDPFGVSNSSTRCNAKVEEYIQSVDVISSLNLDLFGNASSRCPFAVSDNAVVVLDTHPLALALAIKYLDYSPGDRSTIGYAGITTAADYFHINKTRDMYQAFMLDVIESYDK